MMERMEQLSSLAFKYLEQRFVSERDQILAAIRDSTRQLSGNLVHAIQTVLAKSEVLQASGVKGPVAYISFSLLGSNLLLEKFALQVDAYDERFLIDDSEASSEWDFASILQGIDQNFEDVGRLLRRSVIRVQEYELWELKKAYQMNYYAVAAELLQILLAICTDQISAQNGVKAAKVQFTYGLYMERQMPIYQWGV